MTHRPTIEELLDRAVTAINRGDRATADALAGQVLAVDRSNPDAEGLLDSPRDGGEIRRLTILFADLVDSTALSTRIEPEVYRTVVGHYRDEVLRIVNRYEGHIGSTKGDGLLAVFGHPTAHEDDASRAVAAGLDIIREVGQLSERVRRRFGFDIAVRVGVHRGLVYLDVAQDDVYGLGANLAARMCSLADPGAVAVSKAIEQLVGDDYELAECAPTLVKGVDEPVAHFRVVGERDTATVTHGPIVGREAELARLHQAWSQARAGVLGTPGIVLSGEGGIGKSRLVGSVLDLAQRDEAAVVRLFGSPFHTHVGLRPVRRLLERNCGIKRGSDAATALQQLTAEILDRGLAAAALVPLLAPVLGISPASGYRPNTANATRLYEQIAEAVRDYLLACAGPGPGLIVFEDLHWYDEDTIAVLEALLRGKHGRALVLITDRELPALRANPEIIALKPLDDAEADELIRALHPQLADRARKQVRKRCDGIPLYIEEVVAKLKEQPTDASSSTQVPDTLYEALIARVRSSERSKLVVEAAALTGGLIDRRLLRSVVEMDQQEVDAILDELTRGRVLQPVSKNHWRFHHELLREVAAELSPPSVQRRLHIRIADALAAGAPDGTPEWPLIAHHYEKAEKYDDAASAYREAAANARQRGALVESQSHLARALDNVERLPAGHTRDEHEVDIRLERAFLASAAGGHASAAAAAEFERCLLLVSDRPGVALYATFTGLWSYYATRGDLRRAAQLVEALRSRLSGMPDWYRAATDAAAGSLQVFRGEFNSARATLEAAALALESLDSAEIEGAWFAPNDPVAATYTFVGLTRFLQGDLAGAEESFAKGRRRCQTLSFPHGPFTLCYGHTIESLIRTEAGQTDRAAGLLGEVATIGQQSGFDEWVMIAASATATTNSRGSDVGADRAAADQEAHIQALTTVVETWREADLKSFLCWYDAALAQALLVAGRKDAARMRIDVALQMADQTDWHIYDAELLRIRALTHDAPEARAADLRAAVEIARNQGALVFELRAVADMFRFDGEQHRAELLTVLGRFPADQDWPDLARLRALVG